MLLRYQNDELIKESQECCRALIEDSRVYVNESVAVNSYVIITYKIQISDELIET